MKLSSRSIWLLIALVVQVVLPAQGTPTRSPDEEDDAVVDDIGMRAELEAIQNNLVRYNLQARIKSVEDLIPSLEASAKELTDAIDQASPDQAETFEEAVGAVQGNLLKAETRYQRIRLVQKQFPVLEQGIWSQLSEYHQRILSPPSNLTAQAPSVVQRPSSDACVETSTRTPSTLDFSTTQITTCGGVVPLRLNRNFEIRYKMNSHYGNMEFCVWTFVTETPATEFQFTKDSGTFEQGLDGLVYYAWSGGASFSATKQTYATHTITGQHAFMAFSSDSSSTYTGFKITVRASSVGSSSISPQTYSAASLQASSSTFTFPRGQDSRACYNNNERFSAVVQTSFKYVGGERYNKSVSLSNMNTELSQDKVYVYRLDNMYDSPPYYKLQGTFSGQHTGTVPGSSSGWTTAALYLFESNSAVNGRGFTINWSSR